MKSRYISMTLITVSGAAIGIVFAFLSGGSVNGGNLSVGAIFGAIIGLYFALSRQPGFG